MLGCAMVVKRHHPPRTTVRVNTIGSVKWYCRCATTDFSLATSQMLTLYKFCHAVTSNGYGPPAHPSLFVEQVKSIGSHAVVPEHCHAPDKPDTAKSQSNGGDPEHSNRTVATPHPANSPAPSHLAPLKVNVTIFVPSLACSTDGKLTPGQQLTLTLLDDCELLDELDEQHGHPLIDVTVTGILTPPVG